MKGKATRVQTEESGGGVWEHMKAPLSIPRSFPQPIAKGASLLEKQIVYSFGDMYHQITCPEP